MSCFAYTNKNGKRCVCSCMNSECSVECNLYRKYNGIKTHHDLLISKTPEEIAGWLAEKIYCIDCPQEENCMLHGRSMACKSVWLDWLKSPADKEEEG